MTDNNKWLQRVVFKLNNLFLDGSDFDDRRWIFDWDDKLTTKENLDNCGGEDRALETLRQAKVIKARCDENWYRNQVIQAQEELEIAKSLNPNIPKWQRNTVWGDWETTDPAHKEYDYLWFSDGFDYDRFKTFCETHGIKPDEKTRSPKKPELVANESSSTLAPNSITPHPLEPRHYSVRTGVLTLSPTVDVAIAAKRKTKRRDGTKYIQCAVMERLFKSVKNIKSGINFSQALTVGESKIGKKEERKVSNAVTEINKKVAAVGGPDNLIKIQNKKVFVNNSYL
jgi:hypothetical protein